MISFLPFHLYPINTGFHITTRIKINNQDSNVILDTGASITTFDIRRIIKYLRGEAFESEKLISSGLGTSEMETNFIILKEMQLGDLKIQDYRIALMDFSHINAGYESLNLPNVEGIIGSDIFTKYAAIIDYKKNMITLNF